MKIRPTAMDLAMRAKAGVLNPFDVLVLVVVASRVLSPSDPLWRSVRDFGRVVSGAPDPCELAEAGNELLTGLGALDLVDG